MHNVLTPAISVIIPNYNHAAYLQQRIESVLDQTYQNFELILLDDCSTDHSREILEQYRGHEKVSHVRMNEKNSGSPFKQWQKGLALARGEYVWIAESDDWAAPEFLEVLVSLSSERSNVGICFCGSYWMDSQGAEGKDLSIYSDDFYREGTEEIRHSLVKFCTIQNASAMLIRRELAQKYIHAVTGYRACGDWHLYIDVLRDSNLLYVARKLNYFRWYQENVSNKAEKNGRWITEGLKLLLFSKASTINYTKGELDEISRYWMLKTDQFRSLKKMQLQLLTRLGLFLFRFRSQFLPA